jgi:hypothetical protein
MKNYLIIILAITSLTISCKHVADNDHSLTAQEYTLKGMPPADSAWKEESYLRAHIALSNIRLKDFSALPRRDSKKSEKVFSHLISKEYLSFLDDPSKSLRDKAFQIQSLASFLNELGRMYTDNLRTQQYYNEELIDIYLYELHVRKKMLDLAEEIMNSKNPEDISMQSGRDAILRGYVSVVSSLLRTLEKNKAFPSSELKRLSNGVSLSLKENLKYLDASGKEEISAQINKTKVKSASRYIKKNLQKDLSILAGE